MTDAGNDRVEVFTSDGQYLFQWGRTGSGSGEFDQPRRLAIDAIGNVFVAEYNNSRVQKFDASGSYILSWGGSCSAGSADPCFEHPLGIETDADDDVYVVDFYDDRVEKFDNSGTYLCEWGTSGLQDGQFNAPQDVALDRNGTAFVVDQSGRVQAFVPIPVAVYETTWGRLKAAYR